MSCCLTSVYSRGKHVIEKNQHASKATRKNVLQHRRAELAIQTPIPTGDGTFSVAGGGCGGANTFGSNGVTEVADGAKLPWD